MKKEYLGDLADNQCIFRFLDRNKDTESLNCTRCANRLHTL